MKFLSFSFFLGFLFSSFLLGEESITITDEPAKVLVENIPRTKPSKDGMVLTRRVDLPNFKRGAFFRPFSGGGARGNRVEAVAFDTLDELESYKPSKTRKGHTNVQQGQFILLECAEDRYLALLPMTSEKVYGQFFVNQGELQLKTGNFGTSPVEGEIPLVIWSYGDSPYAATQSVWKQVFDSGMVAASPRSQKSFPEEPYGYLGWCSWEFYKTKISEKIITDAFQTVEACGAPVRWFMVDDGYLDAKKGKLLSFGVDKKKFPNGWKPIMALKKSDKIKWVGVWRNFGGYMTGTSSQHTMEELKPYLAPPISRKKNLVLPNGTPEASRAFYEAMMSDTKENGFNFVKVDFQTRTFDHYRGASDPVGTMRLNSEALEEVTREMGLPLLNCIAQPNINSLQTKYSALTRSSPDYNQSDKNKNKCNTYQSFANHLWMGQTLWGDLDMFHTHDERDVNAMAIARAISGGPVYISDKPSKIVPDVLYPFAYTDGKLLRTEAPAVLLPDSFFIHPFRDEEMIRVVAPLQDGVAAIALFNFTEAGNPLAGSFKAKDYSHAGELLQPYKGIWKAPEEGVLVYDRETKSVAELGGGYETEVASFDAKLFLLYPKKEGWVVLGRTDKYLPAAAVKVDAVSENEVTFTLKEAGPFSVWSAKGPPKSKGLTFTEAGNGLYHANLKVTSGERKVTLTR